MLLAEGLISREQYDRAVIDQAEHGGALSYHLVAAGSVLEDDFVRFLARRFPIAHWPRRRLAAISPAAISAVRPEMARALRVLPLFLDGDRLTLGLTDPTSGHTIDEVSHHTGLRVTPAIVSEGDMTWALDLYYPATPAPEPATDQLMEAPLPLTVRATRDFAALGAPPPARPGFEADADLDGTHDVAAASITDALRAIPLVHRAIPKAAMSPKDTQSFGRPSTPRREEGKVVVREPIVLRDRLDEQAYDSWSKPASQPPSATAYSITSRSDPDRAGAGEPLDGRTMRESLKPAPADRPRRQRRRTEGEIIAAMNSAYDRDAIIALALEHLMRFAKRAAFMVVKKNEIRGFDITGDLTNREAVRSFWVPLSTPCSLCRAAHDKQIHLGPLGRSPADSVLSAALGGRPERALIIPIVIQDRTVGILYADRLDVEVPPWSRLERLAQTMAENLAKILRRGRLG